ncbi:MAG TPA: hypothetical protein DCE41_17265, partial [Cytophagales bacterium]|nr:hypothetical protein [Cytophagales bacterium]
YELSATDIASLAGADQSSSDCSGGRPALGTEYVQELPQFEVFPNPTQGAFTVRVQNGSSHFLSVTNLLGQEVYQQQIDASQPEHTVYLENAKPGVYLVRIQTGDRQYQQRLVIE